MNDRSQIKELLEYWFSDAMSQHWFASTSAVDQQILTQFGKLWEKAQAGGCDHWQQDSALAAEGCLALCILLDQLPLNMFRGTVKSFSTEQQAVAVTKFAIEKGLDDQIDNDRVMFLYMPLMHSEDLKDQDLSLVCFEKAKLENNLRFAKHHRELIVEFGRFPHRNEILDRENTLAEIEYLSSKRAFTG